MINKRWDSIWINTKLVTFDQPGPYGLIKQGAIAVADGKIAWVGKMTELPNVPNQCSNIVHDAKGKSITPGLIDCHTHLVFAGNRCNEFELRLQGATYEEIAKNGGGIQSTVKATREVTEDILFALSLPRARALCQEGVTTLEIKSGYGLDFVTEQKMLRVAKRIEDTLPVTVKKTFLGAHTVPKEYLGRSDEYIAYICNVMLPQLVEERLVDAVDIFCENIAFNLAQTEKIFKVASELGLKIKCHAEQLTPSGAAALAARYHAISVDHLEYLTEEGVKAILQSGTVAVLLPGAFYFLKEKQLPPVALLRDYGVPIAIASDCNPGTSPVTSLLLMLNMAAVLFGLTPEEALRAVTQQAARALGMEKTHGTLTVGKVADFVVWDVGDVAELVYFIGMNPVIEVIRGGSLIK